MYVKNIHFEGLAGNLLSVDKAVINMVLLCIGRGDSIMTEFEDVLRLVTTADMVKQYPGVSLDTMGKNRPDLDNHLMSPDEQRKNLAFYARATVEHVGWDCFSEENKTAFKNNLVQVYNEISGVCKQSDFMQKLVEKTAPFIEDRHFMIAFGSKFFSGSKPKEDASVGQNIGYYKAEKIEKFKLKLIDEEYGITSEGKEYPLWRICAAQTRQGEDVLIVSIPNLPNTNEYQTSAKFIEAFDKIYFDNKEKLDKGRIILDVRGNGGGEDKPIDHVAKRLYGNLINTYKRCEIKDTEISNAFLHCHGAYRPKNYERDGFSEKDLLQRHFFSGNNKVLFDETKTFYPFNEEIGYHGRIDILLDRKVGSSAESAYTSFYHHPRVRYIGENTAGMQQYTQGSFTMPCGYMMRVGVTKLTYWDREGENIEVKGHKPDIYCQGKDALLTALSLDKDEGRVMGVHQANEERVGKEVFVAYDPKQQLDPRKAYFARYLEPALQQIEKENLAYQSGVRKTR